MMERGSREQGGGKLRSGKNQITFAVLKNIAPQNSGFSSALSYPKEVIVE